jgi:hypothetical protein
LQLLLQLGIMPCCRSQLLLLLVQLQRLLP